MKYASIRKLDISNGEGVGVSLFVQGCDFRCNNCFNTETWDFNNGYKWTQKTKEDFLKLIDRPYIKRVSILGGEPLADKNLDEVLKLVNEIRLSFPKKDIWLYTGYYWEEIFEPRFTQQSQEWLDNYLKLCEIRKQIISKCDVLVDGRYVDSLRDITAKWRGSTNQRVIDVQKSLETNQVVLYCD